MELSPVLRGRVTGGGEEGLLCTAYHRCRRRTAWGSAICGHRKWILENSLVEPQVGTMVLRWSESQPRSETLEGAYAGGITGADGS